MQQGDEKSAVRATYRGRSRRIKVEPVQPPAKVRPAEPRETKEPKKEPRR